jgi:plastocyanin
MRVFGNFGMPRACVFAALLCLLMARSGPAEQAPVTAQVEIVKGSASGERVPDASNVVVWLVPVDHAVSGLAASGSRPMPQLVQRNKEFEPHLLVVQVGTSVQFPNKDPFLHNVFSLFNGKRFDLGFYEAGSSKSVRFDRPGVSFLFCSIHEQMNAVVLAVETPYFAVSDRSGHIAIPSVPNGRYQMHVWYERGSAENLSATERTVEVSDAAHTLDKIQVVENPDFTLTHKNKYGQDYVAPSAIGYK